MLENLLNDFYLTKFYSVNRFYSDKDTGNTRTNRTAWAIIFKYEGETEYVQKTKIAHSNKNNLVVLPRNSSYVWKCINSGHYYNIEFDTNKDFEEVIQCHIEDPEQICEIFQQMMAEKNNTSALSHLKLSQLLIKLLYTVFRPKFDTNEGPSKSHIILPAVNYIHQHFREDIRNETLAKLCFISTSYFRKIFTEIYQQSPVHYITDLRIQQAKELLHSDFTNITEIAKQVGYDDIYHFSKVFKQKTGFSPLNYVKTECSPTE